MATLKLKELPRSKLVKLAKEAGLRPLKSWSDIKLRKEIREATGKASSAATAPVTKSVWPKEWPKEMRQEYFTSIVGETPPEDSKKAYSRLLQVIDQRVPEMQVFMTKEGPDCYGIYYEPKFSYCNEVCPVMPLCKATCERRPELVTMAKAVDAAAGEVAALSDDEVKAAVESGARPKAKDKAKEKAKEKKAEKPLLGQRKSVAAAGKDAIYVWRGRVSEYEDSGVEAEMLEVLHWMAGRKKRGFTFAEAVAQFGIWYNDEEALAKQNLDVFIQQGDVVVQ